MTESFPVCKSPHHLSLSKVEIFICLYKLAIHIFASTSLYLLYTNLFSSGQSLAHFLGLSTELHLSLQPLSEDVLLLHNLLVLLVQYTNSFLLPKYKNK